MAKEIEPNEDWIKRDQGRIPTKGTAAAERASWEWERSATTKRSRCWGFCHGSKNPPSGGPRRPGARSRYSQ